MSAPGGPAPGAVHDGAQARRGLVLLAMTGSLSMIFIDMTVVGVALPRIGASLGMDDVGQAWIVTSYLLSLASLMAIGGRIGDLVGKVPAFLVGVVAFAAASAVCAFARDGTQMIMGRVLQGVAACLMQPASGALVIGAFAPGERGKAMAAYVGIPMVFMALGPALGGVIVERWGWEWVFLLNLPIAATAVALTLVARPRDARSTDRHIDWLGGGLLLLGLPPLVFGIQQLGAARADGSLRWDDPVTIAALVGGAVALATFVHRQWNHPRPLLRLRLFADHALAADAVVIMCMQFAMTGLVVAGSLYAQDVLGYSPTEAGASLLPMLAPVILVVHLAGRWYDRAGVRSPATWGTAMASSGMLVQAVGAWVQSLHDEPDEHRRPRPRAAFRARAGVWTCADHAAGRRQRRGGHGGGRGGDLHGRVHARRADQGPGVRGSASHDAPFRRRGCARRCRLGRGLRACAARVGARLRRGLRRRCARHGERALRGPPLDEARQAGHLTGGACTGSASIRILNGCAGSFDTSSTRLASAGLSCQA
jgi:EmrB/QacA subfamily drug resistance transporter